MARPPLILGLLLSVAGLVAVSMRTAPLVIQDRPVTRPQLFLACGIISLLLLVLTGGAHFLAAVAVTLIVLLAHSILRNRSLHARGVAFFDVLRGRTPLGALIKQVEYEEEEKDDDPEDPKARELRAQQAQFRKAFREQMRQKYGLQSRPMS